MTYNSHPALSHDLNTQVFVRTCEVRIESARQRATTNALDENTLKGNIVNCEDPAAKEQLAVGWDYMHNTYFFGLITGGARSEIRHSREARLESSWTIIEAFHS